MEIVFEQSNQGWSHRINKQLWVKQVVGNHTVCNLRYRFYALLNYCFEFVLVMW